MKVQFLDIIFISSFAFLYIGSMIGIYFVIKKFARSCDD